MRRSAGLVFILAFTPLLNAMAGDLRTSGFIALESRWFTESPQHTRQNQDNNYSYVLQPEFSYRQEKHKFTFIPFYRDDSIDEQRSHGDIRELHWQYVEDSWDVLVGVNRVFWGVTESRHLVDIINQTDAVEDIDGEDKLGQPMVRFSRIQDWGNINLFVLPGFRERTFAGVTGRFRAALPVDATRTSYESANGASHVDYAAYYSHSIGDWDLGLSYFYGTSREPVFVLDSSSMTLLPYYNLIRQAGVDLQYTNEAWLWKFEGMLRNGQGKTFFASVFGFEYTFYQITGSSKDLGVLMEYLYDDRDSTTPVTDLDDDVFLGLRLAFNDTQDTSVLAGLLVDTNGKDRLFSIEAERRITDHIKLELRARIITNTEATSLAHAIHKDDYLQLQLQYHF